MRPQSRVVRWMRGGEPLPFGQSPEDYDPGSVAQTLSRVGRLFGDGRYFGLEVSGFENVPASPVILVSNHSGGTSIPDTWGLLAAWYRHFGVERPLHVLVHEIILGTRRTGEYFGRRGALVADREVALRALREHRRDLLIMPGGDLDTWRPHRERYTVCFAGRTGYARLAIEAGVPVVPVANAGAHETLFVLTRGDRFARWVGLHDLARAEVWPIHLSLPWGVAVGPWPHLPIPTRLRYRIGSPIWPRPDESVAQLDQRVRDGVQALLDQLKDARGH